MEFVERKVGYWDAGNREIVINDQLQKIVWPGFDTTIPNDRIPVVKIGLLFPSTDELNNDFRYK